MVKVAEEYNWFTGTTIKYPYWGLWSLRGEGYLNERLVNKLSAFGSGRVKLVRTTRQADLTLKRASAGARRDGFPLQLGRKLICGFWARKILALTDGRVGRFRVDWP